MKIQELIERGTQVLKNNQIEDSHVKARVLLQYVLEKSKEELLIHNNKEVVQEKEIVYFQYIEQIAQGTPLQYITNNQEFMGLNFYVDENVLIPQPDTEILVEEAIKILEEKIKDKYNKDTKIENSVKVDKIKILDLCTGSGAIAISIAKQLQKIQDIEKRQKNRQNAQTLFEIYALDISKKALEIARKNTILNEVEIRFILSDMFENIENHHSKLDFDMIVSNPPYIETDTIKILSKEVQNEPHLALDGGQDGMDFYRIIAKQASKYLKQKRNYFIRNRL